jgi:hypothetical protein
MKVNKGSRRKFYNKQKKCTTFLSWATSTIDSEKINC